jgi:hypothetical protein
MCNSFQARRTVGEEEKEERRLRVDTAMQATSIRLRGDN